MENKTKQLSEEHKKKIGLANAILSARHIAQGGTYRRPIEVIEYHKNKKKNLGYVNSPVARSKLSYRMKWRFAIGTHQKVPWNKGLTTASSLSMQKMNMKKTGQKRTIESRYKMAQSQLKHIRNHPERIREFRQRMRNVVVPKKDSLIEVKIQDYLKQLGITFYTHQYIQEIEHGYQCDILIPSMNLIIECDGDYWHNYPKGNDMDYIRTSELLQKGFRVIRLWEREIKVLSLSSFKNKMEEHT